VVIIDVGIIKILSLLNENLKQVQGKKKKLLKCPHISDSFLSIDLTFAGKLQKNF